MKKATITIIVLLMIAVAASGCNRAVFDTHFAFDEAIVALPDGTIVKGQVSSWNDYEDGDQLQVTINGVTYLTHATNVVLIDR